MELEIAERENYLITNYLDGVITITKTMGKMGGIHEALIIVNFDIIYRMFEDEATDHKYTYMDTPLNFFEEL